jgi:aryl-alcohol dehydrogenase-like predicted oxidoreductase
MVTPDMVRLCVHASLGRLRTDYLDVALCHEGNIEDPSVYLEGFEQLVKEGRVRAYGISTNNLDALKRFNANGTCAVVEVDYSLLNRQPEEAFLPYCREQGIGVLVRGPLAMGLLSGRYSAETKFTDTIRKRWHADEKQQANFQRRVAQVDRLKKVVAPGREMVEAALRYVISHDSNPVAIPGAKSPAQAIANAVAGERSLPADESSKLRLAVDA